MSYSTLHQIAPYIGRMPPRYAKYLVEEFTQRDELIVDPFCGSGVVGLEAATSGRRIVMGDINPYAVLLSRAKVNPPATLDLALQQLNTSWAASRESLAEVELASVPDWVRGFFHPETLRSALALRDTLVEAGNDFLLACLLGILHHQRPGFLSYPASNLVPYLRTKKFPPADYPELYAEREVLPRMISKVRRVYRRAEVPEGASARVFQVDAREFPPLRGVGALITSPPYMNALDYVRDNRLRIWFLCKKVPANLEIPRAKREHNFRLLLLDVSRRFGAQLREGGYLIFVLGDIKRGRKRLDSAQIAVDLFSSQSSLEQFELVEKSNDAIPDLRRSRRNLEGTKAETTLVFKKGN